MKNRIKEVRKQAKENQATFADKLGLTKNYISLIETGDRNPSDRTVKDIGRIYGVNENWLLTGEGDMYEPMDKVDEIASIAAAAFNDDDAVRIQLMKIVASLTSEQTEALLDVARQLVEAHEKSSHNGEL